MQQLPIECTIVYLVWRGQGLNPPPDYWGGRSTDWLWRKTSGIEPTTSRLWGMYASTCFLKCRIICQGFILHLTETDTWLACRAVWLKFFTSGSIVKECWFWIQLYKYTALTPISQIICSSYYGIDRVFCKIWVSVTSIWQLFLPLSPHNLALYGN